MVFDDGILAIAPAIVLVTHYHRFAYVSSFLLVFIVIVVVFWRFV